MFIPALFTKALLTVTSITSASTGAEEINNFQAVLEQPTAALTQVSSDEIALVAPPHITNPNYAGVYLNGTNGDYNFVTAEFNIPRITGTGDSQASAFLSFDSFVTCPFRFQAGIRIDVVGGRPAYRNLYEWIRSDGLVVAAGSVPDVPLASDHVLRISLNATSTIAVNVSMSIDSGKVHSVVVPGPGADLCLASAGWLVYADLSPPIADFGDVAYDGTSAHFKNGTPTGPLASNAVVLNIRRGTKLYTETDIGGQSVTVRYAGGDQ